MLDKVRVSGVKILQKRVGESDTEAKVNSCRQRESMQRVLKERWMKVVRECGKIGLKGDVVGADQRESLWQVIEKFRRVFAEIPGRARGYECELKVREHTPFMQRSYPVPYSKRRAVQEELDRTVSVTLLESVGGSN